MEAETAAIASLIGLGISVFLLIDALADRKVYRATPDADPLINAITRHRLFGEFFRLVAQVMFFAAAVSFLIEDGQQLEEVAVWTVATIPVVLAAWSLHDWWRRTKLLRNR